MKFRKKTLLAKIEATYGTDSAPSGAANAIQTKDLEISPLEGEALTRALDKEMLGADPATIVGQLVNVKFKVELAGSGTAGSPPAWGPLVIACGHSQTISAGVSVTYAPIDDAASITIWMKHDKVLHKITGARGKLRIAGGMRQYGYLEFEFIGLYSTPTASGASLSPVLTAFVAPVPFRASTVESELFGDLICLRELAIDCGQNNSLFECSEAEQIELEDRQASMDVKFVEPEIGTHNYWDDAATDTVDEFNFVLGSTAGNIVEFIAPNTQISQIKREDQQGNMVLAATGPIARVGSAEYSLIAR
jgi:hypothetical protein